MIDLSLFDVFDCIWDASWFGFWFLNTVHALYTVDHTCVCVHTCVHMPACIVCRLVFTTVHASVHSCAE